MLVGLIRLIAKLKKLAEEVAKEKWPKGIPADMRSPFRNGNEKADKYGGFKDTIAVTANSNFRPGVVNEKVEFNEVLFICRLNMQSRLWFFGGGNIMYRLNRNAIFFARLGLVSSFGRRSRGITIAGSSKRIGVG